MPPLLAVGVLALAWACGLVWFIHRVDQPFPQPPVTDGIVALTGGAGRVEAALRLLAEHPESRLLISGIGGAATDLGMLAARAGVVSSEFLLPQRLRLHARQLQLQAVQDIRASRKII